MTVDPVDQVLAATWVGEPAVVVASPPGAGKTYVVELVSSLLVAHADEQVAVATQTNAQAQDLCRRFARNYPTLPFVLLTRSGAADIIQGQMVGYGNLQVVDSPKDLPSTPCVVVSTAARWAWVNPEDWQADLLVVDEAWQMTNATFSLITGIGRRYLLVGDPGQIAPVVTAETVRWYDQNDAPHIPAPVALLRSRRDQVTLIRLPHCRRFGPATARIVQPMFYPDLPFTSVRAERKLAVNGTGLDGLDGTTQELNLVEVDGEPYGLADPEIAEVIAKVVADTLRSGTVTADGITRDLTQADVGVVCAHVVQIAAVRALLHDEFPDVMVDSAERWQGLETEVMVVWHPLSGRSEVTEFGRDAGRLCVMLSRHRSGCVVVARKGVRDLLARNATSAERPVGVSAPDVTSGWSAHTNLYRMVEPVLVQ